MGLYLTRSGILWCAISLAWTAISVWVLAIFWHGVKAAARVPDVGKRRALALDVAWEYFNGEAIRMAQHVPSLLIGVASLFVPPTPAHEVPRPVAIFGTIVLFYLFYMNVLSGVNSIRALRAWRRRQDLIRGRRRPVRRRADAARELDRISDH